MLPILIGAGALSTIAFFRAKKKKQQPKILSPNLQYTFQRLLDSKLPAEKYAEAAAIFKQAGLNEEAILLTKRGQLAALPPEEKAKITNAYGAAMASNKPDGIRAVAAVLASKGAVGAATNLRNHASDVDKANQVPVAQKVVVQSVQTPDAAAATAAAIIDMADAANAAGLPGTLAQNTAEQQAADAASGGTVSPGSNPVEAPVVPTIIAVAPPDETIISPAPQS